MTKPSRLDDFKAFLQAQGWRWEPGKPIAYGEQLLVSDGRATVPVSFWPKHGKMTVGGGESALKQALQAWIAGGVPDAPQPEAEGTFTRAHIGMDESGKGDWFGPLVVAAVYATEATLAALAQAGVRDSKALGPAALQALAIVIERLVPAAERQVTVLAPVEYNERYAHHQNLNILLTELYTESAAEVWATTAAPTILCDQFASKPDRLESSFAARGLPRPIQRPRAESASLAVAAASILASATFARALDELGREAGLDAPLPKGSSEIQALRATAKRLLAQGDTPLLARYAKLHFKPIQALLNEPPTVPPPPKVSVDRDDTETILIDQLAWREEWHEAPTYCRFVFVDGAILDWYLQDNGRLDVRGVPHAPTSQILQPLHGLLRAAHTQDEEQRLKTQLIAWLTKRLAPPMPLERVRGIGWRLVEGRGSNLFRFTDGATLRYHPSTQRLQLQGTLQGSAEALKPLTTRLWPTCEDLSDLLKRLFPDWRLGGEVGEEHEQAVWHVEDEGLPWRTFWPTTRAMRQAPDMQSPSQAELLQDWATVLLHRNNKRHLLAHAPTGLGKTAAALVPAVAWVAQQPAQRRIYYLVNRVAQHENPLRELRDLAATFEAATGQPLRVVDLIGRTQLCAAPRAATLTHLCRASAQEARFEALPPLPASWQEVKAHLGAERCAYHTLRALMKEAHVVICDYWWLFPDEAHPNHWAQVGVSLRTSVLIVDEAHNLPAHLREMWEVAAPLAQMETELGQMPESIRHCLHPVLSYAATEAAQASIDLGEFLIRAGGKRAVEAAIEQLPRGEEEDGANKNGIRRLLRLLTLPPKLAVVYMGSDSRGSRTLYGKLLDPAPYLGQLGYAHVHASLSMSGTLAAPADDNNELRYQIPLVGLAEETTCAHRYVSPFPQRNQRWIYCPDTEGTFQKRTDALPTYVKHVEGVGYVTPGVTAVFFSSYDFLEMVRNGLSPAEQALVVAEQRPSRAGAKTIEGYEHELRAKVERAGRAYLFAIYSGALAEGSDFKGNLIRTVICISILVEYPTFFHERLKQHYTSLFDQVARELGDDPQAKAREYAQERFSLSLLLQACGRGIRSERDRCTFVLLDKRYHEYGWRRFLIPRPFNLNNPAASVATFHQPLNRPAAEGWDAELLRFCKAAPPKG